MGRVIGKIRTSTGSPTVTVTVILPQILEVMREDLRAVTHSLALHALRQTPNRVRLVIHREDDEIYEQMDVELVKKRDRGLGLSIVGKKSGPGVFISEVRQGFT